MPRCMPFLVNLIGTICLAGAVHASPTFFIYPSPDKAASIGPFELSSATRTGMTGALMQSAYRFAGRYEIAARYAVVDFADELTSAAYDRAQRLIAAAQAIADAGVSPLAQQVLDDVKTQYKNAGRVAREEEMTIGFNVYIEGHSLKWQNDAGRLIHSRIDGDRIDYFMRSQLQLTF